MNQIPKKSLNFRLSALYHALFISLSLCFYHTTSAQCIVPPTDCYSAIPVCIGQCYSTTDQGFVCCPNFCGQNTIINNPTYFSLFPTCDTITIIIQVMNCGSSLGLQAAILNDCNFSGSSGVLDCNPGTDPGQILELTAIVEPGNQYWLVVDGVNGSACDYILTSISCHSNPDFTGTLDSIVLSDNVACQGDVIETTLYLTGEDYPSFFFSASWSSDTIKSIHQFATIAVPQDLPPGTYEICSGFSVACSGKIFAICDSITINSYIQGITIDTIVCLENGDLTFSYKGFVFDQSGSYLIPAPNIDNTLCDTANYLNLTLYPHAVSINEIQVNNVKYQDEAGDHDPWIELYNKSIYPQDLGGFYLSDDPDNLLKWKFPDGTIIPSDGYLIVWADDEPEEGNLHTNFTLTLDGGTLFFTDPCEKTIESTQYVTFRPGTSYGRYPNGNGDFYKRAPTFQLFNGSTLFNGAVLNEFLAINTSSETDESGEFENWLELYVGNYTTSLYGSYLTDDPDDITKYVILNETWYDPESYIILWMDNELEEGDNHISVSVDPEKGYLALYDPNFNLIDEVSYLKQYADYTFARLPNGVGNWFLNERTFGFSNDLVSTAVNIGYPELIMSPNPVKDIVYLSNLPDHPVGYSITDLHGRLVKAGGEITSGEIAIDKLTPGMYVIQISGQQIETRRFIKM